MSIYDLYGNTVMDGDSAKPYAGKKWAVLGDSISMSHAQKFYHTLIAEKLGFTVQNLAASGKGYDYIRDTAVPAIDEDVALVTIFAGTNDIVSAAYIGEPTDREENYSGKVYQTILAVKERFPGVPLGIITPTQRHDYEQGHNNCAKIAAGIKAVCEVYSVPCFDMHTGSGLLALTDEGKSHYFTDGLHLSDAGHAAMAARIEPFIRSLMAP